LTPTPVGETPITISFAVAGSIDVVSGDADVVGADEAALAGKKIGQRRRAVLFDGLLDIDQRRREPLAPNYHRLS